MIQRFFFLMGIAMILLACGSAKTPSDPQDVSKCVNECTQIEMMCLEEDCCQVHEFGSCIKVDSDCMNACGQQCTECKQTNCGV